MSGHDDSFPHENEKFVASFISESGNVSDSKFCMQTSIITLITCTKFHCDWCILRFSGCVDFLPLERAVFLLAA